MRRQQEINRSPEQYSERGKIIIELMVQVLVRRYYTLGREELESKFNLDDIRTTRVWQEAYEEGFAKGFEKGRVLERQQVVERLQANGQTQKQIVELLGITLAEVRRLAKKK